MQMKMPANCRSGIITWNTASSRGATLNDLNAWSLKWNARVVAEDDLKAAKKDYAEFQKKLTNAKTKLAALVAKLPDTARKVRTAFEKGLVTVEVDTTRHFGAASMVGGVALKFLERRVEYFDAVLKDDDVNPLLTDDEAESIRSCFLPLMALLEDLNHEARRATILSDEQMGDNESNINLFCDLLCQYSSPALGVPARRLPSLPLARRPQPGHAPRPS
jgi:hypothetical protein